ncbi:glutathionylspermidine synthase family protein [Rhizobium sp. BK176]|uniref:glutathionylspermidine synthase family protein n=1 Tax=Rhizobium sp. BK176 TaxID=2587071 RepID=UPI002167F322|nr:glutathionylspermidine synthase family protein [Rhizobium sp. BK176]MCS4088659.1 glutathionylspermidine synthase [Rhizobium sp. BK176]
MERIAITERADWRKKAEDGGFTIHSMYDARYWDERHAYTFSSREVRERLAAPTAELMSMCYQAAERIVEDSELMSRMALPEAFHEAIRASWRAGHKDLYGRFDLAYDGKGPAKLLEFNADTASALFESAVFQCRWLEDVKARGDVEMGAFQFSDIDERLRNAFSSLAADGDTFHFGVTMDAEEDLMTVNYLAECARAAGLVAKVINMGEFGVDAADWLTDLEDYRIQRFFKFYPIEEMMRDEFGGVLKTTPSRMFEPLWKVVLSNKGMLAVLWDMFPNHPNLLPCYFEDDTRASSLNGQHVRKPVYSRQGDNITITSDSLPGGKLETEGEATEGPHVLQAVNFLPTFGDDHTLVGSWVVAGEPAGICILEDDGPVTGVMSRFVPHFVTP